VRIRRADLHDLKALAAIEDLCFGGLPEHCTLNDYAEALADLQSHIFCIGRPAEATGMVVLSGNHAEVTNLAVHPASRGLGYGRQLMLKMMNVAAVNGHDTMELDVRKKNPAVELYKSLGFTVVRELAPEWYLMRWNR
jgi:ribosomal protein S18 acetylase RimI-like enzyme